MTPTARFSAALSDADIEWGRKEMLRLEPHRGTPTERFSAALSALHWGPQDLAREASISERTVRRWAAGTQQPQPRVLEWMELLVRLHRENPIPKKIAAD